jgi:hypothetical protein
MEILTEVFRGFLQVFQANAGIAHQLGHGHFLSNQFPVITNQAFFYPTLLFRDADIVAKQLRTER